jgi:class 3 adenylate cyclase
VAVCAQCGRESPDDFGFCPGCGAPLAPVPERRDVRKVVTVLFCDLTGSTAIGDRTDPEPLRALMSRYYDSARAVLERHGGTVEKFVGDAVMAVFGIPVSTENDALRAVRAAVELRDGVHGLGLEARIGVNTGAVVAGERDTLVTGDAVNVAARLEQAAGPGEILLGAETVGLVRDAVEVEPVELALKGKPDAVAASRLLRLDAAAAGVARRLDRPLVGRARERERLRADFADAAAGPTCRLFTLIGPAGVGKSRLVADFLEHVGDSATVARGRALSYGEGITYWPLVEILIQLGLDPEDALRSSPADTQLATRALLERVAAERPLVVVLDDLQWAEAPLLDLVDHLADWSRDAPLFLLCVARPELLDVRPGWGGGKLNATSILLEPLADDEAAALADELLDGVALDGETRLRILATAEGNPLFLEEMAALARESNGGVDVPPTIQALLQARLDTLEPPDRAVIERGAVEGKVFHRGAVTALAPEPLRDDVPQRLLSLVRKELVRPDRSQLPGDDAFRFRHLLIRDAAYESLPKAVRAELHETFAEWLDGHAELVEQDEIVGYHLEQAAESRRALDASDERAAELGERAAARLVAAGTAAFDREDLHAVRNLLGRAVALLPEGPSRRAVIPDLADALAGSGDDERVAELLAELEQGDERDRAVAAAIRIGRDPIAAGEPEEVAEALDAAQGMACGLLPRKEDS